MASQANNPVAVIRQNLAAMAPEFKAALPSHVSVEKFSRVAMTAIQSTPELASADRRSLFGACVRLAQDGLLPDGREAALVIFNTKNKSGGWDKKVQAMPMIAGLLKKIRQSGDVAKVNAFVVHENDHFKVTYGFDEDVEHIPPGLDQPRGKVIGAYATAILKDGSRLLEVMSLEEINKVRNVSRSKDRGPWADWFEEMARKTVMRRLSKRLPMSTDLDDAFERDATMATTVTDAPALTVIEGSAEPRSKLDALEDEIEEAEAEEIVEPETGEAVEIEREGRADEAHGDQFDGAEEPAWQAAVEAVLAGAREAKTTQALNKVDDEWLKHRAAVSDEAMVARVDDMIAAARADLRSK